jgi:folate-binding Fe-S cluster repair protein YgfZ
MNATYADVRDYAGWLDLSDWGLVRVIGSDRQRFLQAQTTNDLRPLQEGMGLYTAFCTPTGHLLTDAYLLEAEGSYLLLLPPATFGAMLERLSQLIILDEVELIPLQEGLGVLSVQGSCADEVLEEIGLEPPPAGETTPSRANLAEDRSAPRALPTHALGWLRPHPALRSA